MNASTQQSSIGSCTEDRKIAFVLMITPGGLAHGGGIGRMAEYMLNAWSNRDESPIFRVVDSRGPGHIVFSPWHLTLCLLTIVVNAHRRPLLHVHVAGRGSTMRKIIVVHVGRVLGLPIVLHLHDYNYRQSFQRFPKLVRKAAALMFRQAQRVVVLGAGDREFVVKTLGVLPDRVEVVPNAVPSPVRQALPSPRVSPLHIIFLGNPSRRKGVHDLIEALSKQSVRKLDWHLTVAGGGPDVDAFRDQARALGLLNRITFLGWVDRESTERLLRSADILTLPSYDEGMAMSVLEGISYGLCVICTPVGSLPDVVENDVSGVLVQPGNVDELARAFADCINDSNLRSRLGAGAARAFFQNFDVSRYPDRMQPIYLAAVAEAERGRKRI